MAGEATASEGKRKGGGMSAIISIVLVSLIAAGAGTAFDMFLLAPSQTAKPPEAAAPSHEPATHAADSHGEKSGPDHHGKDGASSEGKINLGNHLMTLPPIKGNLAPPSAAWVRLELVVSFKGGPPPEADTVGAVLSEDIVAYLRTVPISQFDSSTGLEHLRDDLEDVARVRTDGKASAVIVKSLIVE